MFQLHQAVFAALGFVAITLMVALSMHGHLAQSLRGVLSVFDGLGPLRKLAVFALVVHLTIFAGGKHGGTNEVEMVGLGLRSRSTMDDNILCSPSPFTFTSAQPTVTPEDIARLWQLWEVRTNLDVCYTMPEGAMMASNWWVRGAYEDVVRVSGSEFQVPSFRFPYGSNEYCSVWAFSWGKVRFELGNTNTEIVAVGAPMSAVPYLSRLWSTADTNGTRFVTWENFALNRDTNTPVNAQIELAANGDFITRSNGVETVYRRVDPEDWDGDGWENGDDPDPYVGEDFSDYFYQELPEGANEAAYCWIEIRPRWNSDIWFYGDAPSNLDDPYVYGKAGEIYRVRLLIGKTYDVEGSQQLDVVAKSDERIEVSNVESDSFTVVWPVAFTVAEGPAPESRPRLGATWNDGGKSFYVMPNPPWLRGAVTWTDNYCCGVWGDGTNFTYACDNKCTCEGCTAYGSYWYEGYGLPVWGISCGCHYVEDHGSTEMSLTFDKSAAIYEDDYTNRPGVVVHPTPSNVVLRCEVYGGTYGGRLTVTLNEAGQDKIARVGGNALPNNVLIQPDTTRVFETVYTPLEPSDSENDIVAVATFVEDFTHDEYETQFATLTSVKVELETVYEAPENPNPSRHIYGVGEKVKLKHKPQSIELEWGIGAQDGWSVLEDGNGCDKILKLHYLGGTVTEVIGTCCGEEYRPSISVYEPQSVLCLNQAWDGACSPLGVAGGFGMNLWLFIGPMHLSFQGIDVAEIPCETVVPPTGYYATTNFNGVLTHNLDAGAGCWHHVSAGNYWCIDDAQSNIRRQQWSNGQLQWNIPIQWYQRLESGESWSCGFIHADGRLIGGSIGAYKQVFDITADGTVTITKHSHWIDRNTNDVIRLDGVQVHDGGHRR